jgi:putative SOS response-associated peptidase YedK
MAKIHNRMPVILDKDKESLWLDKKVGDQELLDLIRPYDDEAMQAYEISTLVNNPINNSAEILEPVAGLGF